ncbi:MAG TPA: hypothetical protein VNF99_18090 [Stellaceae bacterium]|nr:hypothetical protein [Stellaceae bacterium]
MFKSIDGASWLLIIGLIAVLGGAIWAATGVIMSEKTATELASTKWDMNEELRDALRSQSRKARDGLVLVAIGSVLQIAGVVWQAFAAAK